MSHAIRSLRIEFIEEERTPINRLQTLAFVTEELSAFIKSHEFINMVLEITKNIYDHASAKGALDFVIEDDMCQFTIVDCGEKSTPVNGVAAKNEGLDIIRARAESLGIIFDEKLLSTYKYCGIYAAQMVENIFEPSA